MNFKVLFIIRGDPRTSPRPAEAIRIAAGVGTWKKVDISVYLRGAAVLALSEYADEFIDEDNYTRYFPIIGEWGRPIYAQRGAPLLGEIGDSALKFEEISDEELAGLAAHSDYVVNF
jgi:sulfur relay (sulfurtransferase) DsrF/TusC family protein